MASFQRTRFTIFGTTDISETGGRQASSGATDINETISISASATITEADDTVAGAATVLVSLTASITEGADTVSGASTVLVSLTATITEADDTLAGAATGTTFASANITEADDAVAGAVSGAITASANITEANDTVSSASTVQITVTLNVTEEDDTLSATATAAFGTITANADIREEDDTLEASTRTFYFITRGEIVYVDLVTSTTTGSVPSASSGYGFSLLFNIGTAYPAGTPFSASLISPSGEETIITANSRQLKLGRVAVKTGGYLPAGNIMLPNEYVLYQTAPDDFDAQGIWQIAMTSGNYFSRYGDVRIAA
jgi:hypothetical protein